MQGCQRLTQCLCMEERPVAVTSAGAADRRSDKVGGDAVRGHCAGIEDLAVNRHQLEPGGVQVQVAPLQRIPLLLPVQHPLQPLPPVTVLQCDVCLDLCDHAGPELDDYCAMHHFISGQWLPEGTTNARITTVEKP